MSELEWVHTAYDELLHNWRHAEDLESFEHVAKEACGFIVGKNCDPDLQDELIAFWETAMPPVRMLRVAETQAVLVNRTQLHKDILALITHPVLLVHGEASETCPKKFAEKLASELINAEGGAFNYTIKGATGSLSIIPQNASLLHKVFVDFVGRLPHVGSELKLPNSDVHERMKTALTTLSELVDDSSIASLDPASPLSFCSLPPAIVKKQADALKLYRKGIYTAFSPLGPDGRPARKYSDRKVEHWFTGEENGLSIAERPMETKLRRATNHHNVVEKPVIKGSMARVVASTVTPASQLQRLVV
ncbi:hypothetical protein H0H93_000291 [Arthromyces matolae]|nr:hypothetical protein H0H93_000291 [Arthromyces matolae]